MNINLPDLSLVVLIGPSGCGKSTLARKHFKPTEILSSDFFRGLIADDDLPVESIRPYRGWSETDWRKAAARLRDRGWLDREGAITTAGRGARAANVADHVARRCLHEVAANAERQHAVGRDGRRAAEDEIERGERGD